MMKPEYYMVWGGFVLMILILIGLWFDEREGRK